MLLPNLGNIEDDNKRIYKFSVKNKKNKGNNNIPNSKYSPYSNDSNEKAVPKQHSIDKMIALINTGAESYDEKPKKKKKDKKKDKKKKKKDAAKFDKINNMGVFNTEMQKQIKHDKDVYIKRFSGNFEMVKDFMIDIETKIKSAEEYIDEMKAKPGRGTTMAISNQNSAIAQLMSMKLQAMKQVMDLNKTLSDYEIKQQDRLIKQEQIAKEAAEKENPDNNESLIQDIFANLVTERAVIDTTTKKKSKKKKESTYDFLDERVDALDSDGELLNDNERAIVYENQNVELVLYHIMNTGRNKVVALDDEGFEIFDYPIPGLATFGKFVIDYETNRAEDSLGRKYRVIYKDSFAADREDEMDW